VNLKEKAINAYNENLKMEKEVSLFKEKMKDCLDVNVAGESTSITLENLEFRLSKNMDHLLAQKYVTNAERLIPIHILLNP